ncbi:MAG: protein kinase [Chloroflexi bacterium]|nr:protein kinase [Chloroflexota bacterium]
MNNPLDLIGKNIGHYRIQGYVMRGLVSDVFLGQDEALHRQVIIKVLRADMAESDEHRHQFRAEAEAIAQIKHSHIVQLFNTDILDGERPYIVLPYIEGGTLREVINDHHRQGRYLSVVDALDWTYQIADAMREMHDQSLIHGALQPAGVLLRPERTAVLASLGRAYWADLLPQQSQWPPYAAPEQLSGGTTDSRTDVYGIGLLLYELVTNQHPFANAPETWPNEPTPVVTLRPALSAETAVIIDRCLAPKPENRYGTVPELLTALETAVLAEGGQPYTSLRNVWQVYNPQADVMRRSEVLTPTPKTPPPAQTEERQKVKWPIYLVATLVIVALFVAGWRIFTQQSAQVEIAASITPAPTEAEVIAVVLTDPPEPAVAPTSTLAPVPTETNTPVPTDTPTATPTPTRDLGPTWEVIGHSVNNQEIKVVRFGDGEAVLILVGGLHAGFNPASVDLAMRLIDYFEEEPTAVPDNVTLYIVPSLNPDSADAIGKVEGRLNANGVDLNRNWDCRWQPDAKWGQQDVSGGFTILSEPETAALAQFILDSEPEGVIFWQARSAGGLSSFGACGITPKVSFPLAQIYGDAAGYNTADFEAQVNTVLTGDATNWLDDIEIPAVSVLLPDYDDMDWENNKTAVLAVLDDLAE